MYDDIAADATPNVVPLIPFELWVIPENVNGYNAIFLRLRAWAVALPPTRG